MTRQGATSEACTVVLNGAHTATAARCLAELITEQGYGGEKVATAVNGTFVPAARRAATVIADGDSIEIVSARQGG